MEKIRRAWEVQAELFTGSLPLFHTTKSGEQTKSSSLPLPKSSEWTGSNRAVCNVISAVVKRKHSPHCVFAAKSALPRILCSLVVFIMLLSALIRVSPLSDFTWNTISYQTLF